MNATILDSPIDSVVWCGNDRVLIDDDETIVLEDLETRITNIMFMISDNGYVYASNTYG